MDENNEILDLTDANDVVVGKMRRGDMANLGYRTHKGFVRFAVAFIINKQSEIWVPTRGLHKVIAPGGCDFSVAEHVLSGESYGEAIERAFSEEAGMVINAKDLSFLGKLGPSGSKPSHEAVFAYLARGRDTPTFSQEEFTSAEWMSMDAFKKLLVSGPATKTALLPALRLLETWLSRGR